MEKIKEILISKWLVGVVALCSFVYFFLSYPASYQWVEGKSIFDVKTFSILVAISISPVVILLFIRTVLLNRKRE